MVGLNFFNMKRFLMVWGPQAYRSNFILNSLEHEIIFYLLLAFYNFRLGQIHLSAVLCKKIAKFVCILFKRVEPEEIF